MFSPFRPSSKLVSSSLTIEKLLSSSWKKNRTDAFQVARESVMTWRRMFFFSRSIAWIGKTITYTLRTRLCQSSFCWLAEVFPAILFLVLRVWLVHQKSAAFFQPNFGKLSGNISTSCVNSESKASVACDSRRTRHSEVSQSIMGASARSIVVYM